MTEKRCPFKGQESCSGTNPCCMEPDEDLELSPNILAAIIVTLSAFGSVALLAWLI